VLIVNEDDEDVEMEVDSEDEASHLVHSVRQRVKWIVFCRFIDPIRVFGRGDLELEELRVVVSHILEEYPSALHGFISYLPEN
jgi:histone deacetylase complex regulatory component SIN3